MKILSEHYNFDAVFQFIFFPSQVSLSHTKCWPSWKNPAENHVSTGRRPVQSLFQLLLPIPQCGWMIHTQVHQCLTKETFYFFFFHLQYIHLQSATGKFSYLPREKIIPRTKICQETKPETRLAMVST